MFLCAHTSWLVLAHSELSSSVTPPVRSAHLSQSRSPNVSITHYCLILLLRVNLSLVTYMIPYPPSAFWRCREAELYRLAATLASLHPLFISLFPLRTTDLCNMHMHRRHPAGFDTLRVSLKAAEPIMAGFMELFIFKMARCIFSSPIQVPLIHLVASPVCWTDVSIYTVSLRQNRRMLHLNRDAGISLFVTEVLCK